MADMNVCAWNWPLFDEETCETEEDSSYAHHCVSDEERDDSYEKHEGPCVCRCGAKLMVLA